MRLTNLYTNKRGKQWCFEGRRFSPSRDFQNVNQRITLASERSMSLHVYPVLCYPFNFLKWKFWNCQKIDASVNIIYTSLLVSVQPFSLTLADKATTENMLVKRSTPGLDAWKIFLPLLVFTFTANMPFMAKHLCPFPKCLQNSTMCPHSRVSPSECQGLHMP